MFRPDYDEIVAFHPYRTHQPWDNGGTKLLQIDGVNGPPERAEAVRSCITSLEQAMRAEAKTAGLKVWEDNHYGYTVVRYGAKLSADHSPADTYYHVRFSDGSCYLWLMPGPPSS